MTKQHVNWCLKSIYQNAKMLYSPLSHSGSLLGVLKCLWSTPCCAFYAWSKGEHYGSFLHSTPGRLPSSPWAWWYTTSGRIASHLSAAVAAPHPWTPTNIIKYIQLTIYGMVPSNKNQHHLLVKEKWLNSQLLLNDNAPCLCNCTMGTTKLHKTTNTKKIYSIKKQ